VATLNPDMVSVNGASQAVTNLNDFHEDTWLFKHSNLFFAAGRGFEYKYVPKTNEIAGYIESTIQENQNLPQEQRGDIRGTFMAKLGGQYCKCAASNWDMNKSRTEQLSLIFRFAVTASICAILAMSGYLLLKSHIETKPQDLRIVTQH
jgi:hypothetical protein